MKLIRIPLIAAAALALAACGGSNNGAHLTTKEQAANALMSSNQAYSSGQQQQLVYQAAKSAIASAGGSATFTVKCRSGNGSVTADANVSATNDGTTGEYSATVKLSFDGCEAGDYVDANGKNGGAVTVDGSVNWAVTFNATTSSFTGSVTMNGELDFSGGITDKVVANNVKVDVSATSGATGQVSVNVSGSITTNESTFTYDGGAITINGGSFSGTAQASGNT